MNSITTSPADTPLWHAVGIASDIPDPGNYLAADIASEPLVVVRNGDGVLRALSRVCRHRGFDMLEGVGPQGGDLIGRTGSVKRISCPYHAWTYDLDGQLIGAPVADGIPDFDKGCVSLPSFEVAEVDGLVFVCLDAPAPDLAAQLSEQGTNTSALAQHLSHDAIREEKQ